MKATVIWAALLGVAGFLGGFFLPMYLTPEANQGPLLGLFTGPIAAAVGYVIGYVIEARRRDR